MQLSNSLKASVVLIAISLGGCSLMAENKHGLDNSVSATDAAMKRLDAMKTVGATRHFDGQRLAGTEITIPKTSNEIPALFKGKFTYLTTPQTLQSILTDVSRRTGVAIRLQPGLRATSSTQTATSPTIDNLPLAIDWRGSLSGFFDYVAAKRDLHWRFNDGSVELYRTDTRSFPVFIPAGKKTISASIQLTGASGEEANKSDSLVNVSSVSDIDPYKAILEAVELIVRDGSKEIEGAGVKQVVSNPSLGSITVTASPAVLDKVERYINANNQLFAQNVIIGVKVYNLNLKKGANAGAAASISYDNLSQNLGLDVSPPTLLNPTVGTPGTFSALSLTGSRFAGSSILVQALEQLGDVSLVTSGQVVAANGQPAPLQVANEFTYLASSATVASVNAGVTTTLIPGSRTVGFTANFLPLILGDNRLLLQYQINLSSLISLTQVSSGGSSIQTPNIASQSLQQQAFMRDGQTLVLFGYEQQRRNDSTSKSLFSFSRNSDSDRTIMVIVMEVFLGK